jgi:hypothetical protein
MAVVADRMARVAEYFILELVDRNAKMLVTMLR